MKFAVGDEIYFMEEPGVRHVIVTLYEDGSTILMRMDANFRRVGLPHDGSKQAMDMAYLCSVADFDACMWRVRMERGDKDHGVLLHLTHDEMEIRKQQPRKR